MVLVAGCPCGAVPARLIGTDLRVGDFIHVDQAMSCVTFPGLRDLALVLPFSSLDCWRHGRRKGQV